MFIDNFKKSQLKQKLNIKDDMKIVAYLPTHRSDGITKGVIRTLVDELISLNDHLASLDMVLVVKPHYYDREILVPGWVVSNIFIVEEGAFDVYELLSVSDALITDYSSIMFDFEITGKPILFFMPDLEEYQRNERELYFEPCQVVKNFCMSAEDLVPELINISKGSYHSKSLKIEFNEYKGGNNSARLANKLFSLLKLDED